MHKSSLVKALVISVLAGWILPTASMAKDAGGEEKDHKKMSKKMIEKYDTDQDGQLSEAEKAAMTEDKKAAKAELMKKYDTDEDGQLSEAEKAEMKKAKMEARKAGKPAKEKPAVEEEEEMEE